MNDIVKLDAKISAKLISLRGERVLIDSDVAELYGVETKRINEAVRNNPDKFPLGYLIELTVEEWEPLKSKFSSSIRGGKTKLPTAFTERGLYMLATILKSPRATTTTIAIIEVFTKVREINRAIVEIIKDPENEPKQKSLLSKAGTMISKLIMPAEDDLEVVETETTYKINVLSSLEFTKKTRKTKKK